ncbi:MAG TPA: oxidative damage protection protein [Gemmatimonadales bacterium]|nr:oxidative damage protection protein [Gemmatimonadales bacterium]
MSDITCTRCGQTRAAQSFQPFPNDAGRRVFQDICAVCWAEWLKYQQQLINHYALNLREPKAREFLLQQMEQFLFTSAPRP